MAKVSFKKGLRTNIPATKTEGTFYISTDERAIYLDVNGSTRIRIGDFQEFASMAALSANVNPNTTALYYVADINTLAKWDGTQYITINPNTDTGMTSVELSGSGNAVTAATYDANGRKLTLTKGATYVTEAEVDTKIGNKIGTLSIGSTTYNTVKEYVDQKTSGLPTDATLTTLGDRITATETDITGLKTKVGNDTVANQLNTLKTELKGTASDTDASATIAGAKKYTDKQFTDKIGTVPSGSTVMGTIDDLIDGDANKSIREIALDELTKKLIPANATAALDTLQEIAAWIQAHPADASAMNSKITALEADAHTHTNKTELDKIATGDKAKWDGLEDKLVGTASDTKDNDTIKGAKKYADSLIEWGTF